MVWAEPLFTVLVLGFVLLLEDACRSGRYLGARGRAGVVASAAILVKYLGFALVAAGIVALVVAGVGSSRNGRHEDGRSSADRGGSRGSRSGRCSARRSGGCATCIEGEPLFGRRIGAGKSLADDHR